MGDVDVLNSNHIDIIAFQCVVLYFGVLSLPIAHRLDVLKALMEVFSFSCGRRSGMQTASFGVLGYHVFATDYPQTMIQLYL